MPFTYQDVQDAYERISPYLRETPLEESYYLGADGRRYFFKLESFQRAKSFKICGALNKMLTLSDDDRARGVATVSSGNHGSSVAYAASLLGIERAQVIVPKPTPQSKIDKIEYFGAEALLMGNDYDEAHALGMAYIEEHGMTYIDPYDYDPLVYAGQGTIAVELFRQNADIDTIVVPIGGGGLITGIAVAAKAIRPGVRIVGVQTEACPSMAASLRDHVMYTEYESAPSICDALVGGVGHLSYEMASECIDELLVVSEESIGRAVAFMAKQEKYVVEGGSCTTVAAVRDHREAVGGTNVALVLSGGNIDGDLLARLVSTY